MNEMMDRVPPHNHEAEQSVIGAIFLEPQALITASEMLCLKIFTDWHIKRFFRRCLTLSDQGKSNRCSNCYRRTFC